jgi:hypothetical protein
MIQAKFGLNWSSGFRGKDFWKSLQTDNGRQVMAIAHTGELKKGRRKSRKKIFRVATFSNPQTVGRVREAKKI